MCVLGWRSQQKVSSEETHKGAETCLPGDGHTESLLVGSGMSTQLVLLGKQKAMLMFAMRQGNSYLYCKCQLTE